MELTYPGCRSYIREAFIRRSFPSTGLRGILCSLSKQTLKQYDSVYLKWWKFCSDNHFSPYIYKLSEIINFLNQRFEKGCSFSVINTYKSALALIMPIGKEDEIMIHRYLKGIRNINPPKARYATTWDPHPVLVYLEKIIPLEEISLEQLSFKLVTLLVLISAHRLQTLSKIKMSNIHNKGDYIEIFIDEAIKTSGKNRLQPVLRLPYFRQNSNLCLASTLEVYIRRTESIRPAGVDSLILTVKKPIHAASPQTISRWIKNVLSKSGVDINIYSGYSAKHAAVSTAHKGGASIEIIRQTAGWSNKSNVFCLFYHKPILPPLDTFAKAVFKGSRINVD